jgi:hypothetical protein
MTNIFDFQEFQRRTEALDKKIEQQLVADGGLARGSGGPHPLDLEAKIEKLEAAIAGSDRPMVAMTDREIDAKFETAEARTDTKVARMEGKLDLTLEKIGHLGDDIRASRSEASGNRNAIIGTIIAGFIAMFFGLFAVLQWSDARMFGMMQLRETMKPPTTSSPVTSPNANPPPASPEQPR